MSMRLRQVALIAESLEPATGTLCDLLGLEVAHRDPGVGRWGLENVVIPLGGNFLEILAPIQADTAGGRYLKRRGGDGGYMVILQCADAIAERRRITGMGVRAVWEADRPAYLATHFHPADTAQVLLSVDSVEPSADYRDEYCSWWPAGPEWQKHVRTDRISALVGVELQNAEPAAAAHRWSEILQLPVTGREDAPEIALDNGRIRFVADRDGRGPGVGGIELAAADPRAVIADAKTRGVETMADGVVLCGTRIYLRPA